MMNFKLNSSLFLFHAEPAITSNGNGAAVILRESPLQMSHSDFTDVTSEWVNQNHQNNNVSYFHNVTYLDINTSFSPVIKKLSIIKIQ